VGAKFSRIGAAKVASVSLSPPTKSEFCDGEFADLAFAEGALLVCLTSS
jgi:hypothetical protein